MNVLSISALLVFFAMSVAMVRLRNHRARVLASFLTLLAGSSFLILGARLSNPASFLCGASFCGAGVSLVLGAYRHRITLIVGLLAISISGLVWVADAWEEPWAEPVSLNERLQLHADYLGGRGGTERVRISIASDVPASDLEALGEAALQDEADLLVVLDSESTTPSKSRLVGWTSKRLGIPVVHLTKSTKTSLVSLRPYLQLALMGEADETGLPPATPDDEAHRFRAWIETGHAPATMDHAMERKLTLVVRPGSELERSSSNGLHEVQVGFGTSGSLGGLMETTPYGLVVRPSTPLDDHRSFAALPQSMGRMLLLSASADRGALAALVLLVILAFSLPLAVIQRTEDPDNE